MDSLLSSLTINLTKQDPNRLILAIKKGKDVNPSLLIYRIYSFHVYMYSSHSLTCQINRGSPYSLEYILAEVHGTWNTPG